MQQIPNAHARLQRRVSMGFTLIEVVVVLVVMAVVASVVLPVLTDPRSAAPAPPFDRVMREASDLAVRRAEWLTLRVRADGRWDVRSDVSLDTMPIAAGALGRNAPHALTMRLSPLGACLTSGATMVTARCARPRPTRGDAR